MKTMDIKTVKEKIIEPLIKKRAKREESSVSETGSTDRAAEVVAAEVKPVVKILFVDDEVFLREVFGRYSRTLNRREDLQVTVEMDIVKDPEEVLNAVREKDYDAIILDNNYTRGMKDEGVNLARRLRSELGFTRDKGLLFLFTGGHYRKELEDVFDGQLIKTDVSLALIISEVIRPLEVRALRKAARDKAGSAERQHAEGLIRESEDDMHLMFESSNVGMAILDINGQMVEKNKAFVSLYGAEKIAIADLMQDPAHMAKLDRNEPIEIRIIKRGQEVLLHISPFGARGERPFGYLVQVKSAEEHELQVKEFAAMKTELARFSSLSKRERTSMLQVASSEKIALVYGNDYRKIMDAIKSLGAVGFKGKIVIARTQDELKGYVTSGEVFDIVINTTNDDIKELIRKILAGIETPPIIDDIEDKNRLQNTLLSICA